MVTLGGNFGNGIGATATITLLGFGLGTAIFNIVDGSINSYVSGW